MFYTSGTTGRPKGVRGALSGGNDSDRGNAINWFEHGKLCASRRTISSSRAGIPLGAMGFHIHADGKWIFSGHAAQI